MAYYINLFSPETYFAFSRSNQSVSGFRERHKGVAASIQPGDKLICYMTKLSRWIGVLEVTSPCFFDDTPLFIHPVDPYSVRFWVVPSAWPVLENTVPVNDDACWSSLSFTKDLPKKSLAWTAMVRGSLRKLSDEDGTFLENLLQRQMQSPKPFPLSEADNRKLTPSVVNTANSQIAVSVPDDEREPDSATRSQQAEQRESIRIQALLAQIGERMNFKIWLPRGDRQRVLAIWHPADPSHLLERLPLNYNDVTLRTIENIDVLWIRNRSIMRAFEVEHTTSIYSGILRMADLIAL